MKNVKFLLFFFFVTLAGCEKKIDFKLNNNSPELVVEGTIENGEAPRVILTRSVGYFSQITPELLTNGFVHGAIVSIADGNQSDILKEYNVEVYPGVFVYYYSTDSLSQPNSIKGELNKSYSLKINDGTKEYGAVTTIPKFNKIIDSIWWKPAPGTDDTTKVIIMVKATDPAGFGDYIRYFTKRNKEPFYAPGNSAFDDQFIDGTTYSLQLEPGTDRNAAKNKDGNYFYRGDTVTLKLSSINKATFDFWRTMEYSYQSIGNPFATPVKVLSNVSNGALGYFGGYASQYRTLIIPH